MRRRKFFKYLSSLAVLYLLTQYVITGAIVQVEGKVEPVRAYSRSYEFDYVGWTLRAIALKFEQFSLGMSQYISTQEQKQFTLKYLQLIGQIKQSEYELEQIYTDPQIENPEKASQELRSRLQVLYEQRSQIGPLIESILQNQLNAVVAELGFTFGGQTIPPVLYHSTPLPYALIVSPREVIQQDANISLRVDTTLEDHVALEQAIERDLGVSALVVNIGGVGAYPTMVAQTTNLNWLAEVVAHEWIHNYLTMRPLGIKYNASPELRIMNETTASIAGTEIGTALIERFYPEFAPEPSTAGQKGDKEDSSLPSEGPPAFDYRAEMHETRVSADFLLAEGKIEEAEAYLEERRIFFWENGYHIRRLNQAYFAFHGAYADEPISAAGEDPVGAAVRRLYAQSSTLLDFVNTIAWMTSFEELETYLTK
jgi:hypothetical protein